MIDELLRVEYGLDRLLWQDPDQNQLDVWEVALQIGQLDDQAEAGVLWEPVARAVLYGIDIDRCLRVGESPFEVADAHSADVAYYYEHVLDRVRRVPAGRRRGVRVAPEQGAVLA